MLSDSPERIFIMMFKYIILRDGCYPVLQREDFLEEKFMSDIYPLVKSSLTTQQLKNNCWALMVPAPKHNHGEGVVSMQSWTKQHIWASIGEHRIALKGLFNFFGTCRIKDFRD